MIISPFGLWTKQKKSVFKPLESISTEAVKLFQSKYKKPIRKFTKTSVQQSANLSDTDITNIDDPIE